ncbi:MAG: methyltransferase domain-containing protein [Verrucomicrobiota bacterium]
MKLFPCPGQEVEAGNIHYSLRRYFVDCFYQREVSALPEGGVILDVGGNKKDKRGCFNISNTQHDVIYANLSDAKSPDVICDAARLPFKDGLFKAVICGELLEHVADPASVVREAWRVLMPGGAILITCPFMFRVHGDPYDFARYTGYYWEELMRELSFTDIKVEPQGRFYSVLYDSLRDWLREREGWRRVKRSKMVVKGLREKALKSDETLDSDMLKSYTTGYGIKAVKRNESGL